MPIKFNSIWIWRQIIWSVYFEFIEGAKNFLQIQKIVELVFDQKNLVE